MTLGIIGLGRMGRNMALRLHAAGHPVIAMDLDAATRASAADQGLSVAANVAELVAALPAPRALWLMIPAGAPVDDTIAQLEPVLATGDLVVDGGNSNYKDSQRRAARLAAGGLLYADVGVSGGIWGRERGYCMMAGGPSAAIDRLRPALDVLAPPEGWRHVGPAGAGHYAKMIHNGIEYGMMQAYGEGFEILAASGFDFDLAEIAGLWNRGSVVRSWLLELAERAFAQDPKLESIRGYVEDSGEGRWTVFEAIDRDVPAPVLAMALFERFRSRQDDSFRDRVIAALRKEFGGHAVQGPRE